MIPVSEICLLLRLDKVRFLLILNEYLWSFQPGLGVHAIITLRKVLLGIFVPEVFKIFGEMRSTCALCCTFWPMLFPAASGRRLSQGVYRPLSKVRGG